MARTYESALSHLAALQSNRAITSLFTPPAPPLSTTSGSTKTSSSPLKQDLNAQAIPEMLAWLKRAGISQEDLASRLRCIHVAGTKGKGSVCAYLTALLTQSGSEGGLEKGIAGKVGTYTSPHLVSVRERIAIDGEPISRDLFARYFFEVWDSFTEAARAELVQRRTSKKKTGEEEVEVKEISEETLQGPSTKPFYFRFLTILAFRAFLGEGVRSAVVECGIGGEYDSTNILPPACMTASVVAQLGIDHVGMLGGTLPEIAWHKAGVCKAGRKCFTRRLQQGTAGDGDAAAETMQVLRLRAREKGAVLVEVDDADVEKWGGVVEKTGDNLQGGFQKYNQALAVLAAREHLRVLAGETSSSTQTTTNDERLEDIPKVFTAALKNASLRGRCETRRDDQSPVTWLIDGAHTAESLREVARWFVDKIASSQSTTTKIVLLFNQQDRDAGKLLRGLLEDIKASSSSSSKNDEFTKSIFAHAIFARNDLRPRTDSESESEPERDLSVQESAAGVLRALYPDTSTSVLDNVADAVAEIRALADEKTVVLVTGSLHLVGALLRTLEPDAED